MFPNAPLLYAKAVMNRREIATLVKGLRRRLGLTQEQFAHEVGVTYSSVNHWENAKRVPQPFLIKQLMQMQHDLRKKRALK